MPKSRRSFAIIGLGTFGSTVAEELVRFGNHVLGIDSNEKRVALLANTLSEAVIADGTDEIAMREAGIGHYDVVLIAMGEDLEASILCTMNARSLGAKSIWVKSLSRTHHRILNKLGADRIVHPEQEMGQQVAQSLHNPLVFDYAAVGNGHYMASIIVPSPLKGKTLNHLQLTSQFDLRCIGLMRGSNFMDCMVGEIILQNDDKLLLLGKRSALRQFSDSL